MMTELLIWSCNLFFSIFWSDKIDVVEYLVNKGADVNIGNKFRRTPIHTASLRGNFYHMFVLDFEFTKHLLFFHIGNFEITNLLVGAKAPQVDAKDDEEFIPLHLAAQSGKIFIYRNRCNKIIQNFKCYTCFLRRRQNHHTSYFKKFKYHSQKHQWLYSTTYCSRKWAR